MTTMAARAAEREAEAVRAASARWLETVASGDPSRVAACYADDGTFLVPNVPFAQGRDQVTAVWAQLLGAPGVSLRWTPSSVEVAQAGDLAYEIGTYRVSMDGPQGRMDDDGKYVVVWRKRGGAWEVAADIFNSSRPLAGS